MYHNSITLPCAEVYAAETLEDLFLPDQPLVSAPGTIIHPMTNINGPFFTMEEQAYVVPDYTHPGAAAIPPPSRPRHRDNDDDDDEANWDRWDGYPTSVDDVGISTGIGSPSAGRGRDNPYYQGQGEEYDQRAYYENYDRYAQPPPGYDEVAK